MIKYLIQNKRIWPHPVSKLANFENVLFFLKSFVESADEVAVLGTYVTVQERDCFKWVVGMQGEKL